eukprot:486279_1
MGICEPMTWFWGNLTASKDDNKDKDKDQQKIKWSNCNVILYLCSSVLTAIWMICYITNEFAAFFGAFIICVSISIYSLIHFRDLFGIDNEVNEATDHCTTMQTQEKELEAEIKQLETIANEMKTTTAGIETETKNFSHENKDYESKLDTLENTGKLKGFFSFSRVNMDSHELNQCICDGILRFGLVKDRCKPTQQLRCDNCLRKCDRNDKIYFCPLKNNKHPNGYDICGDCAVKLNKAPLSKLMNLQNAGYDVNEIFDSLEINNDDIIKTIAEFNDLEQKHREVNEFIDSGILPKCHASNHNNNEAAQLNNEISDLYSNPTSVINYQKRCIRRQVQTCHSDIKNCIQMNSIFRLNKIQSPYNTTMAKLLLDNFLHFLDKHNNQTDFDFVLQSLGMCDITKCSIFRQHYRNRNLSQSKTKNANISTIQALINKIHCFFCHSYDIGHRILLKELIEDEKKNVDTMITKSKVCNFLSSKHKLYRHHQQRTMTSKFNPFATKNSNHSSNKRYYSFGVEFQYGSHDSKVCKSSSEKPNIIVKTTENDTVESEENHNGIRIQPFTIEKGKYASLKEEMLMNTIAILTLEQFEHEYNKISMLHNSFFRKREYLDMSLEQLLCLAIYCNFDTLQSEFSKTYRKQDEKETDSSLLDRHSTFWFFGRALKTVVNVFGRVSKWHLYHGMSGKLILPAYYMNVVINTPFSTSKSFPVAVNFADNGLVIEFEPCPLTKDQGGAISMAVNWISDYPNEAEYLFIQCNGILWIRNVIDPIFKEYESILQALEYIDTPSTQNEINNNYFVLTQAIINHQASKILKTYTPFKSLDFYSKVIINTYCNNKTYFEASYHNKIVRLFRIPKNNLINMKLIHFIFPNIQIIHLRGLNLCTLLMDYVYDYLKLESIQRSDISLIWIKPEYGSNLSILEAVKLYNCKFKEIGFRLEQVDTIGYMDEYKDKTYLAIKCIESTVAYRKGKMILDAPRFKQLNYYNAEKNISTRTPNSLRV